MLLMHIVDLGSVPHFIFRNTRRDLEQRRPLRPRLDGTLL